MQGLDDPKLIFQAVPAGLAGRRFAPPSAAMRVSYLPRNRMRFSVTSSFVSGTSGSGDSGHSSSLLFPTKLSHLLNMRPASVGHLTPATSVLRVFFLSDLLVFPMLYAIRLSNDCYTSLCS